MDLVDEDATEIIPQRLVQVRTSKNNSELALRLIKFNLFTQAETTSQIHSNNNVTKKEEEVKFESSQQSADKVLKCKDCDFLSFISLDKHNCVIQLKFSCPGCPNKFTSNESLTSHLLYDHRVRCDEIELFIDNLAPEEPNQNIHIVDYQLLKKPDTVDGVQPKSKIFIKDVTLLRKPDLPHNDMAIPNIFDSLDLTTTEDDIFEDFLGSDDQIFDDDFDFEESANLNNVESFTTPEPVPEVEIVTADDVTDLLSGKIFVRKNLCNDEVATEAVIEEATESVDIPTSKIYVRSHESLTSQVITTDVTQQPSEASTPDCIIVSSEIISEAPTSKIFIRNIETLTNPLQETAGDQFYPAEAGTPENYLNLPNSFPPAIFVRSYDSLVNETRPDLPTTPLGSIQVPRCKISIKNMNTLIEPILMQPPLINPSSMIFGQAQNLVIHMRPQHVDESLLNYRDTSMTPDTLPGSSNVSTCGGNDDVIILDDSEVNDAIFTAFDGAPELQNEIVQLMESSHVEDFPLAPVELLETIETPERNETPNEKTVLQKLELMSENQPLHDEEIIKEVQPMVRIPIDFTEPVKEPERKRVKIVRIIRIKKKKSFADEPKTETQLNNIQVVFKCSHQDCNLHFTNEQLLKYHKKCHATGGSIICPECASEEFKTFNTLHTHLWRSHKVDMDLYSCKLCGFKTPILARLRNFHAKIHSDEKNYKCSFAKCEKSFKNSKQLKNHSQIHKAKRKTKVKVNIEPDTESMKKIRCSECNKGFSSESGLYIHSMEHKTDEKRFNCKECEYSTNDHNSFRRHKSQHSMVHHYKCPGCDYTSIQSNTYRKHLEKQHPELAESLLYKCVTCKFTTISKGKYDGHMTKHCDSDKSRKAVKKSVTKIKVKSNLLLTDPMIHCMMKDLLPNQANNL